MARKMRLKENQGEEEAIKTNDDPYPSVMVANAHPISVNGLATIINLGMRCRMMVESRIRKTPIARLTQLSTWNILERKRLWVLSTVAVAILIGGLECLQWR